jgi:polygalacturonase
MKHLESEYRKNGTRDSEYQKEFLRVNNFTESEILFGSEGRATFGFLRPPFIQILNSKNILIKDVLIRNSPFWNINPVYCENVTITGVRIEAPNPSPNTDGIDPDSCKNVFISNVTFNVGDDCIAIKSGRDIQGRSIGRPTENVMITNCTMFRGMSGVAIGSEESGGVKNVTVKNCVFNGTDRGIRIKATRDRGGIIGNTVFSDIHMNDIRKGVLIAIGLQNHL